MRQDTRIIFMNKMLMEVKDMHNANESVFLDSKCDMITILADMNKTNG